MKNRNHHKTAAQGTQRRQIRKDLDRRAGRADRRATTKASQVTFHPDAAGDFEFACACKVHAVDEDGNEIALDPEQASLLTLGEEARDVELVRGRDPFSATVAELSKKSPALPLTCVVKGSASFPTIIVRDIRVEGAKLGCSTSAMWAHFSLTALNKTLLTPLTSKEVKFNQESPHQTYSYCRGTRVNLSRNPLGNPPQVVLIQIENPGLLPASFSVHLPNERDIELEPWADEASRVQRSSWSTRLLMS